MIELAWVWLRHQPDSPLSVWFRERVGTLIYQGPHPADYDRRRIALWRYLETGLVPEGAALKVR